jgi:biopolymer transport protein ExbB
MHTFFIFSLVATSIVAVAFIVERAIALKWDKVIPPTVAQVVSTYRSSGDLPSLVGLCEQNPSPVSRLLLFAAEHLDWPKNENVELIETRARHELIRLERGLVVLETIVGIAPLMGLVGTIYGLITLFGSMDSSGVVNSSQFALGISTALYATLLGLLVAIPALIAWSYFSKKVENLSVEMATLCDEFLRKHYRSDASPRILKAPAPRSASAKAR